MQLKDRSVLDLTFLMAMLFLAGAVGTMTAFGILIVLPAEILGFDMPCGETWNFVLYAVGGLLHVAHGIKKEAHALW